MVRRGKGFEGIILALLVLAAAPAALQAQDQRKLLEDERRREMNNRPRPDEDMHQTWLWDGGGWLHAEFDQLNDPPLRDTRTDRYVDLRLWGEIRYERIYSVYARIRTDYTDFNSGDQFSGTEDNVFRSPHFDEVYVDADWTDYGRGWSARAGRAFVSMGSGLIYNDLAYMLQGTYAEDRWAVRAWVGHSIIHQQDIDQSIPHANKSYRGFFGAEGDYLLSGDHRAYGMVLVERDHNTDPVPSQDYEYNASYVGVGARGTLWAGLGYSAEAVYEFGTTANAGTTDSSSISGFAALASLDYQFAGAMEPMLMLQYMYGSGDSDRTSVTETAGGNESGTSDSQFLSFGYLQTGYSLFPRVSNIHILRMGGTIRPFESIPELHKLQVGVFGYVYRKARASSPISDPQSYLDSKDVGEEIDVTLRWRIFSDLGVSINYGCFFPGAAYLDDSARNFFSAGMTYSF